MAGGNNKEEEKKEERKKEEVESSKITLYCTLVVFGFPRGHANCSKCGTVVLFNIWNKVKWVIAMS